MFTPLPRSKSLSALSLVAPALAVAGVVGLAACSAESGRIAKPTLRANVTVVDDFEVELSSLGYSATSEADYDSFEVGVGATFFATDEDGSPGRKLSRAELVVGSVSVEDFDIIELTGGGRYFFRGTEMLQPFLSVNAVASYIEDIEGFEPGTQLALRAGGGVELAITDSVFFDVQLDYTLPLIAAESDPIFGVTAESELSGLAVRVGVGFIF